MATSSSQRPSFRRPHESIGNSPIKTASTPNLLASQQTSSRKPPPLPTTPALTKRSGASGALISKSLTSHAGGTGLDIAAVDGLERHQPALEEGYSPFTMHPGNTMFPGRSMPPEKPMYPGREPLSRTVSDDTRNGNQNLEVGDVVDVPGGMHGLIKYIGEVRGKYGHFAGVELSKEFAARGKNDGDVDGIRYFNTSIKGAGIFLPSNKAYKRLSPSQSSDSMPPTPDTASGSFSLGKRQEKAVYTPTSASRPNFSQSVGPGRARSPDFKPKRPSLPRPDSPQRKQQSAISTPASRPSIGAPKLSKSMVGGPRYAGSPSPAKFGGSVRSKSGDPGKRAIPGSRTAPTTPHHARPQSRAESQLGPEAMFDEDADDTPVGVTKTANRPVSNQEVKSLKAQLIERDRQLDKQNADLEEMQSSIAELQMSAPKHNSAGTMRSRGSGLDELDGPQLRALVREKNEKIAALTSDFDAHRAQFRNTIDSLERTSDETNRIYEQQVEALKQEIRDLQDRGDDVETVAQQLKQLEELVQELEEGLEDARRGEAEARGEVEFLRGEVERTRSELRREREKTAAALKGVATSADGGFSPSSSSREVEQRDDEIRGLKAIIHSLSGNAVPDVGSDKHSSRRGSKLRNSGMTQANGHNDNQLAEEKQARQKLEREVKDLEGLVDRKTYREEELEHEIERLRKQTSHMSADSNSYSEKTTKVNGNHRPNLSTASSTDWRAPSSPEKQRGGGVLESMTEDSHSTTMTDGSSLYCEMCEAFGHEIFTCPNINGDSQHERQPPSQPAPSKPPSSSAPYPARDASRNLPVHSSMHSNDYPPPLSPARSPVRSPAATPKASMANPMESGPVGGKNNRKVDMEKWCALCERDGHDSVDCPFEDLY